MPADTSIRKRAAAACAALACALLLAACSATAPTATPASGGEKLAGSLKELFQQELAVDSLSSFEREVLQRAASSGRISEADYDDGFQRYQRCVADLGYTEKWTKLPSGLYRITPPAFGSNEKANAYMKDSAGCAEGTIMRIESLYLQQQNNPDLLADPRAVAIGCLRKLDAVDASYTPEDLDRDADSGFTSAPFSVDKPDVNECLYSAGFAVATDDAQ